MVKIRVMRETTNRSNVESCHPRLAFLTVHNSTRAANDRLQDQTVFSRRVAIKGPF